MKQTDKSVLTVPNALTLLRIVIIFPMARFLLRQNYIVAGALLLVSAVSDMLDGLVARKLHQISDLGKILDPIADKLTLMAVVVCVNVLYPDIFPFVIVLFMKELLMLCGGAFLLKLQLRPPAARWFGKLSTVIFYSSVVSLILLKAIWSYTHRALTLTLLTITTISMLFSLCMYTLLFLHMLREREKQNKTGQKEEPSAEPAGTTEGKQP